MQPGRELDALVAVHVMGWTLTRESWYDEEGVEGTRLTSPDGKVEVKAHGWDSDVTAAEYGPDLPAFTTDIAVAWAVVELAKASLTSTQWRQFCTELCENWALLRGNANGDAPRMIVDAALKALGVEVPA